MKTVPEPMIDWQGHQPRHPLNWYIGVTADDLGPAGWMGDYLPVADTCEESCPRCAAMRDAMNEEA